MRMAKSSGFVLTLVIVCLGLMAVVLLVLSDGTQTMLWQTDRMYLAAVERNLVSSGAAWASAQLSAGHPVPSQLATDLDAKLLSDRPCSLSVGLVSQADAQADVRIAVSCSKARWTVAHSHTYEVPAR
jgi:hypothetical protein